MIISQILTGRIILLTKNEATLSPILQGEMYPNANGEVLISHLSQVYTESHFKKFISQFVNKNYRYIKSEINYETIKIDSLLKKEFIDFTEINYESTFNSHWLYLKNLSQRSIGIKFRDGPSIFLNKNETLATCTGKSITYPLNKILKEKDTIKPMLLIEKIN